MKEVDIFTVFENIEWPATKQDLLQYATDRGIFEDVFNIINDLEVDDDYYFSSLNDFMESFSSNDFPENDSINDDIVDESLDEENF